MYKLIEGTLTNEFTGSGIVLVTKGGKVLLLKKPRGPWGMPGGKPAYGELPHETALRETFEETGIAIEEVSKPITIYYKNKKYYSYFIILDNKKEIHLSNEHKRYKWVHYTELPGLRLIPPIKENLNIYLKKIKEMLN